MKVLVVLFLFVFTSLLFGSALSHLNVPPLYHSLHKTSEVLPANTSECTISCHKANQTCAGSLNFCESSYTCANSGYCVKLLNNGEHCKTNSDCKSSNCANGSICEDRLYAGIGESCVSRDCQNFQAFCNYSQKICQAKPVLNEPCGGNIECAGDTFCNFETNRCAEFFSIPQGAPCRYSTYNYECLPGLACIKNFTTPNITCEKPVLGSHKPCTVNVDCSNIYENCGCTWYNNGSSSVCIGVTEFSTYTSHQAQIIKSYYNCMANSHNNCLHGSRNGNAVMCDFCKKEICDYLNVHYALGESLGYPNCIKSEFDVQLLSICTEVPIYIPIIFLSISGLIGVFAVSGLFWQISNKRRKERETLYIN